MRSRHGWTLLGITLACGGDGSGSNLPAGATALDTYVKSGVPLTIARLGGLEPALPYFLNPASPGATGVQWAPDLSPGAPPNTWLFTLPIDGDGNGTSETTLSGRGTFTGDPATAGVGFGGHLEMTLETASGLGNFAGTLDFTLTAAGRELSGSGSFTESVTGNITSLNVDPSQPLLLKPPTGAATAVANACAYSVQGDVDVTVSGPAGSLAALWGFLSSRRSISVTNATYTDGGGQQTSLPNSSVTIECGGGSFSDWSGVFTQNWACLPPEFGQAELAIAVTGASTITISDEDPPGSGDISTYTATAIPGNPHAVRGFFIAGPPGFTYREDFTWTLSETGDVFSQRSIYVYQEGPNQGSGGICGATATRTP